MLMHMDAVVTYILSMGLLVILLLVWLVHKQRTGQGFVLWLASGLVGILLGSVGSFAVVCASGLIITAVPKPLPADAQAGTAAAQMAASTPPASGTPPAGGMGGGGMGGGGMGGGMGMGGGGRGPNPKRDLTTLVRKLNLLTDDISLQLTPEQTSALLKGLNGVDAAEKFSDDEAKKMYEELFAILNDDQKAKLDVIGLPFGRGTGGGGGMGGGQPDPHANPFQQENNLKALKAFRGRFAPRDRDGNSH